MVAQAIPVRGETSTHEVRPGGAARSSPNVAKWERWASLVSGGLLALYGLKNRSSKGFGLAAAGGGLLYRGLTGHCYLYQALGVSTAEHHGPVVSVGAGEGVKVVRAVTINRSPEDLYRVWHNFEDLPRFMSHLVSVRADGNTSHWTARGPGGTTIQWSAETINDEPNRLIAWRSLEGSRVATAGSVTFTPAPGGRGTEVKVTLKYDPPAGKLGSWIAWAFGEEPSVQVRDDLFRFKQLMETGEMAR